MLLSFKRVRAPACERLVQVVITLSSRRKTTHAFQRLACSRVHARACLLPRIRFFYETRFNVGGGCGVRTAVCNVVTGSARGDDGQRGMNRYSFS